MERLLLRVSEAAEMAGISRSLAYDLVKTGEWPSVRIRGVVRVPVDALERWIEMNLVVDTDEEGKLRGSQLHPR